MEDLGGSRRLLVGQRKYHNVWRYSVSAIWPLSGPSMATIKFALLLWNQSNNHWCLQWNRLFAKYNVVNSKITFPKMLCAYSVAPVPTLCYFFEKIHFNLAQYFCNMHIANQTNENEQIPISDSLGVPSFKIRTCEYYIAFLDKTRTLKNKKQLRPFENLTAHIIS